MHLVTFHTVLLYVGYIAVDCDHAGERTLEDSRGSQI